MQHKFDEPHGSLQPPWPIFEPKTALICPSAVGLTICHTNEHVVEITLDEVLLDDQRTRLAEALTEPNLAQGTTLGITLAIGLGSNMRRV